MDGEDIVQDALFEAYRKLDTFDGLRALSLAAAGGNPCQRCQSIRFERWAYGERYPSHR